MCSELPWMEKQEKASSPVAWEESSSWFCWDRLGEAPKRSRNGSWRRAAAPGTRGDCKFQMSALGMFCVTLLSTININDIFLCDGFSSWLTQKKTGHTECLQLGIWLFCSFLILSSVFSHSFYHWPLKGDDVFSREQVLNNQRFPKCRNRSFRWQLPCW